MCALVFGVVLSLAPTAQLVRTLRMRESDQVSATWLAIVVVGTSAWAAYGIEIDDGIVIGANVLGAAVAAITLAVVIHFRR